jgi:hypothetical protein
MCLSVVQESEKRVELAGVTDAPTLESIEETLGSIVPNILPDGVEEPNEEEPPFEGLIQGHPSLGGLCLMVWQ